MYRIELIDKDKIEIILPLLTVLNSSLSHDVIQSRLKDMSNNNYLCVGVFDGDRLIGISGLWVLYKYYVGKHIEPDNVIVLPEYRSKGIGVLMMNWIDNYAKSIECEAIELNCYVTNNSGIKFWLNQGFKIIGYHCQKML